MKTQIILKSCGSSDVQNSFETFQDLDAISNDEDKTYLKSCRSLDVRNLFETLQDLDVVLKNENQNHSKSCESSNVRILSESHQDLDIILRWSLQTHQRLKQHFERCKWEVISLGMDPKASQKASKVFKCKRWSNFH